MTDLVLKKIHCLFILICLFSISSCISSSDIDSIVHHVNDMNQKIQLLSTPPSPLPPPTPRNELPFETTLHSKLKTINYIRYSPDGTLLLIGEMASNGSSMWDLSTGLRIRTLKHGTQNGCFSPDNRYLVTTDMHSAKLWESSTGKELRTFGLGYANGLHSEITFSPDGKYLSINLGGDSQMWEISTGRKITMQGTVFDFKNKTHDIPPYFSSNGKRVVVYNNGYKLVDVNKANIISELTGASLISGFSFDSKYCLTQTMGEKTYIDLWNASTGVKASSFMANSGFSPVIDRVVISPDNQYTAVFKSQVVNGEVFFTVTFWDTFKGIQISSIGPFKGSVTGRNFSPDGKYMAINYSSYKKDGTNPIHTAQIYEVLTAGKIYNTSQAGHISTSNITFNPDGKSYAVSEKGGINIYETSTGKPIMAFSSKTFKETMTKAIAAGFSPDGKSILTWGAHGTKIWDVTGAGDIKIFKDSSGPSDLSPDGKYLLCASDMTVELKDIANGIKIQIFTGKGRVNSAVFSPDGKYIATGSGVPEGTGESHGKSIDNSARIWDVKTGKEVRHFKHREWIQSVRFSPDGKYLLAGSGIIFTDKDLFSTTTLWDVQTGRKVRTVKGGDPVFDPYGNYFITVTKDGSLIDGTENSYLRFWDVATGKNSKTMTLPKSISSTSHMVSATSISDDGQYLAVAAGSNCWLWGIKSGNLLKTYQEDEFVVSIDFSPDGKQMLTACNKTVKIRDFSTGKENMSLISVGKKDWVVKTENGFFDATEGAKKEIYFVKGMQIYELDQFFEGFYRPKLLRLVKNDVEMELPKINISEKIKNSPPPSVEIISPSKEDTFDRNVTKVDIKITDNGGGIDEIKLLHNGKRISEDARNFKVTQKTEGRAIIKSYHATLVNGKNTFTASAYSTDRIESRGVQAQVMFQGIARTAASYILAIGINKYQNNRLNLNYARQDAGAFVKLVSEKSRKLFNNVHVTSLHDREATRQNIMDALDGIAKKATADDVFTFYFAGHGSVVDNSFYFIPSDNIRLYEKKRLNKEAISSKALQEKFAVIKALKQLVIIDACQSGSATQMLAMRGAAEEKALAQLARSSGVHVLAAAGSEQFATEFAEIGHGVFTYALLQGLQGEADGAPEDGKVTVYELKSFIDDQVPELTEKHKGEAQYPNTFSRGNDFPLILK